MNPDTNTTPNGFGYHLKRLLLITFIVLLLLPTSALAEVLSGKVVGIADGDTITILDSNKTQHKIRLYGIDTPEKGQAFGNASKKHISGLVAGKTVDVTSYDIDKYRRIVGVVSVNGVNVNKSLIGAGLAWQYRKYCKASFCDDWLNLEKKAKSSKIGLWADHDPVPPWEWRRGVRNTGFTKSGTVKYNSRVDVFHGNTRSHVFHAPTCRNYDCKNCIKIFKTRSEALSSGYKPCGQCNP